MKKNINEVFSYERALYGVNDLELINCKFQGEEDGESALKEAKNIKLENCFMDLRYPLWHDDKVELNEVEMTANCRAALWYTKNINIENSKLHGIKALRECEDIVVKKTDIISPEFGWRSNNIQMQDTAAKGEYFFFEAKNVKLDHFTLEGKYSFQYVENMEITNSILKTKDAFWHTKNVTVKDSIIEGEYLAWYCDGLTLINCKIIGTQPLCYCTNLKLINCTMEKADFSFEYSDVEADIKGSILSVKNPRSGFINADKIDEIIITDDAVYDPLAKITVKEK